MILKLTECGAFACNFLKDLVDYPTVDKLAEAIVLLKSDFVPSDFVIVWEDGKPERLMEGGRSAADADRQIRRLKKLPARVRQIPNDTIYISADVFESELYIWLDGKPEPGR